MALLLSLLYSFGMSTDTWASYYALTSGRKPRKLLLEALAGTESMTGRRALDIGAGDMTESIFLLEKGYEVTALDNSPASQDIARKLHLSGLDFEKTEFEKFDYVPQSYDLISAQFALPFTTVDAFNELFPKILRSLRNGGMFVGNFFGVNDQWNTPESTMTFHTREDLEHLLSGLRIVKLAESEEDKETAAGVVKHWHVFDVIATK